MFFALIVVSFVVLPEGAALTAILGLVAVVSLVGERSTLQTLSGATQAPDPTATVPVSVCGVLATPQPAGSPASIAIVPSTSASPAPTVTYPITSVVGIVQGKC
jgi:hypothetical protein